MVSEQVAGDVEYVPHIGRPKNQRLQACFQLVVQVGGGRFHHEASWHRARATATSAQSLAGPIPYRRLPPPTSTRGHLMNALSGVIPRVHKRSPRRPRPPAGENAVMRPASDRDDRRDSDVAKAIAQFLSSRL